MIAPRIDRCALAGALLVALAGCAHGPAATPDDLVRREAEFAEAVASGDVERFRSFVAEDATFISPDGSIAEGREAVVADWRSLIENPERNLTWKPLRARLSDDGSLGYTFGEWSMTRAGGGGSQLVGTGRYATVWRKGTDGVWRVVLDFGNADAVPRAGVPL